MPRRHPNDPRRPARTLAPAAVVLLGFVSALLVQTGAFGQRAAGGLPNELKSSNNAGARQPELDKFAKEHVGVLKNGKNGDRQKARELLIREAGLVAGEASVSYRDAYATAVNNQLLARTKGADAPARLNAAIVLDGVAAKANNGALAPAATQMAQDPCAGVSLWGIKAAQKILPSLAASGGNTKLTGAVVAGVKKHPDSPDLADEAYKALTLDFPRNLGRLNAQAVPVLLPDALKLFELRVKQYETGQAPAPRLDKTGASFLTFSAVWGNPAAAKHHAAIMQQLSNLIGVVAQHAAARGPAGNKELIQLFKDAGDALSIAGANLKDADIQAAAKSLKEVPGGIEGEELTGLADKAYEAIKAKFPNTKPFPTIAEDAASEPAAEEQEPPRRSTPAPDPDETATDASDAAADDESGGAAPADADAEATTAAERTPRPARGKKSNNKSNER